MSIITKLRNVFKLPSPLQVATSELALASLEVMEADSNVEFNEAIASYNRNRIRRLQALIAAQTKE